MIPFFPLLMLVAGLGIVCVATLTGVILGFRHAKEMEAMRTNKEIAVAKINTEISTGAKLFADDLKGRVEKLARDVKDLSTPERIAVVNELAKKFKHGLGIRD